MKSILSILTVLLTLPAFAGNLFFASAEPENSEYATVLIENAKVSLSLEKNVVSFDALVDGEPIKVEQVVKSGSVKVSPDGSVRVPVKVLEKFHKNRQGEELDGRDCDEFKQTILAGVFTFSPDHELTSGRMTEYLLHSYEICEEMVSRTSINFILQAGN